MHEPSADDLYAVLGVARDAPAREIRRAYRRLARQHHPDLTRQADGAEQFVRLAHAYEVLYDPAQRARYDRTFPRGSVISGPPGLDGGPVPPMAAGLRRGILELSDAETSYVARHPLALHDAHGHTIALPAGTRHGDRITVLCGAHRAVLTVRTYRKT